MGEDAISIMLNDPDRLSEVPKLPKNTADSLLATLRENQGLEHVMIGLNDYGFGPQLSMKIFQVYKQNALEILEKKPL